MGKIDLTRVVLGGLLAGLIINVSEFVLNGVVLAEGYAEVMRALGKSTEMSLRPMVVWIVAGFLMGIAAVWLYAAIRPRFGAGPKTAACAGATVWFLATFLPSVGLWNMALFPGRMLAFGCVWALVEMIVATIAGAWAYKEA